MSTVGRPRIHHTPTSGWVNDPYGLSWHDGLYHLFFQYVPGQTDWALEQHWGHATSPDLLHWTELPPALAPGDGDDGIWSGSLIQPEHGPACAFYTAVDAQDAGVGRVRVATPDGADWLTWSKGDVVATLPPGLDVTAFRDPYVVHDGERWRMYLGAGLTDGRGVIVGYESADLRAWSHTGIAAERDGALVEPLWTGTGWECPQLFPLGGRWVLTISVWEPGTGHDEAYAIGDLADGVFVAESWHRLTYGPAYYAGSAFTDDHGDRGLVHWLREVADVAAGWAGAHSLPHTLTLVGDALVIAPHRTVTQARTVEIGHGPLLDLPATADVVWQPAAPTSTLVLAAGSGPDATLVATAGEVSVQTGDHTWTMPRAADEPIRLVLDGPIAELFTGPAVAAWPLSAPVSQVRAEHGQVRAFELA